MWLKSCILCALEPSEQALAGSVYNALVYGEVAEWSKALPC